MHRESKDRVRGGEGRLPQPCLAWRPIFMIIFSSSGVQAEMTWRNVVMEEPGVTALGGPRAVALQASMWDVGPGGPDFLGVA